MLGLYDPWQQSSKTWLTSSIAGVFSKVTLHVDLKKTLQSAGRLELPRVGSVTEMLLELLAFESKEGDFACERLWSKMFARRAHLPKPSAPLHSSSAEISPVEREKAVKAILENIAYVWMELVEKKEGKKEST
jgi:hypothetical protein